MKPFGRLSTSFSYYSLYPIFLLLVEEHVLVFDEHELFNIPDDLFAFLYHGSFIALRQRLCQLSHRLILISTFLITYEIKRSSLRLCNR